MTIINNSKQILKIGRLVIFPGESAIVNRANWATTVSMNEEFEDGLIKGQIIAIDDGTVPAEGDYENYLGNPSEDGMVLSSTVAGVRSWLAMLNPADFASLVDGKVPADQLPSYVDDVLEYANLAGFPEEGETGKIYVAIDTNKSYRWSGSAYVEITSGGVVLGNTSATAYRGDFGETAYNHSQLVTGNPHNSTTANVADTLDKRYVTDAEKAGIASIAVFTGTFTSSNSTGFAWTNNTLAITHDLGNRYVKVLIYDNNDVEVNYTVTATSTTVSTVSFPIVKIPITGTYKVRIG
jgi:hypothetical protein